jgi:hypothetical protein
MNSLVPNTLQLLAASRSSGDEKCIIDNRLQVSLDEVMNVVTSRLNTATALHDNLGADRSLFDSPHQFPGNGFAITRSIG